MSPERAEGQVSLSTAETLCAVTVAFLAQAAAALTAGTALSLSV